MTRGLEPIYIPRADNLHQLSVTMSRVTYFIVWAHTGTGEKERHRKRPIQKKKKKLT